MKSFLNYHLFGNTVEDFIILFLAVVVVYLLRKWLSRRIAAFCYALFKRWAPGVEKKDFIALLLKPLEAFLILITFVGVIDHFTYPASLNFKIHFLRTDFASVLVNLKLIILSLSVIWIILRSIDFVAMVLSRKANVTTHPSDNQLVLFFRDFVKAIIGLIGLVIVLKFIIGKEGVNKFVGALGIGAAALALAAKESIENLIGSFIILLDKPFRIGDYIKINNVGGTVEKVGLRSTRLRTDDKTYVTVPNKQMVDNILDNITQMTQRRVRLLLELAPDSPPASVLQVIGDIQELLKADPNIIDNFTINLDDITRDSLVIQVIYFTHITEWQAFTAIKEKINVSILESMDKRHVKLARRIDLSMGNPQANP